MKNKFRTYDVKYYKSFCEIKNGVICKILGKPTTIYRPFDFYEKHSKENLFFKFAKLHDGNDEETLNFIQTYGFLGLNNFYRQNMDDNLIKEYNLFRTNSCDTSLNFFNPKDELLYFTDPTLKEKENIKDIQRESLKMNLILQLISIINESKIEQKNYNSITRLSSIMDQLSEIRNLENSTHFPLFSTMSPECNELTLDFIYYGAKLYITRELNEQINYSKPIILTTKDLNFQGSYTTSDLLCTMYIMIYLDITENSLIRKCQNTTCTEYFYIFGNDKRKIYCDNKCAHTQNVRNTRAKKKLKDVTQIEQEKR